MRGFAIKKSAASAGFAFNSEARWELPEKSLPLSCLRRKALTSLSLCFYLKQTGTSRNTEAFERGRCSEAYGLIGAALIRDHKIGIHRVQSKFPALYRGVERL